MPSLTYNYVYFQGGPHTRQPRSVTGYGGFQPIGNLSGAAGTLQSQTPFSPPSGSLPLTTTVGTTIYHFAFVNVSGGTEGGQTSFNAGTPPQVTVGTAPIVVLVVYLPSGSIGGPGTSGASIDAFDESTGSLVDDTFVSVTPNAALTSGGNVDGWVPTTNTETITADAVITPTQADFDKWVNLGTGQASSAAAFSAQAEQSYDILAFYKAPPVVAPPVLTSCQELVQSIQKLVAIGIPGPRFTVAEWDKVLQQLRMCVQEGKVTQQEANELIAEYNAYNHAPEVPPKPLPL